VTTLYLYHGGPRVSALICRAMYRYLLEQRRASGCDELVIGCCSDEAAWFEELAGPGCSLAVSDLPNTPLGPLADLGYLAPAGAVCVRADAAGDRDGSIWQWKEALENLAFQLAGVGLNLPLPPEFDDVPMLALHGGVASTCHPGTTTKPARPSIYLDNTRSCWRPGLVQANGWFVYDVARLADLFPDYDVLHTGPVTVSRPNLVDLSHRSWDELAQASERASILIGTTFDPFALTLTEANRFKPKAICGYDARVTAPPWDYPGNPLELLATMDELIDFCLANVPCAQGVGS